MLFILPMRRGAMLEFVWSAFEDCCDAPWSSEGILKLINVVLCSIWTDSMPGENNIANRIGVQDRSTRVDQFPMLCTLFLAQKLGNFT
jgi:hypothetical protein